MAIDILRIEKHDGIIRADINVSRANNCLVLKRVCNLFLWHEERGIMTCQPGHSI